MLDVLGNDLSALPVELRSLMSFIMPMKLKKQSHTLFHRNTSSGAPNGYASSLRLTYHEDSLVSNKFTFKVELCDAKTIKKKDLLKHLASIAKKGDPILALDLWIDGQTIFKLPTKASLLKKCLEQKTSALYEGPLPKFVERNKHLAYIRWAFLPLLFLALIWLQMVSPRTLDAFFGDFLFGFLGGSEIMGAKKVEYLLPLLPRNAVEAFDFGQIVFGFERAQAANDTATIAALVAQVRNISGRADVTAAHIAEFKNELVRADNYESLFQKVTNFFSLVNTIWLISVLGIVISIIPAFYFMFKPQIDRFLKWLAKVLKKFLVRFGGTLMWIAKKVILPFISKMHEFGVFEFIGYYIAFRTLLDVMRFDFRDFNGFMYLALIIGFLALCPLFFYSAFLHQRKIK